MLSQINYKVIISNLIDNKIFTGYNSGSMVFQNGQKLNNILWLTTFTFAIDERPFYYSGTKYQEGSYPYYTSTKEKIINCDRVKDIPDDYSGLMGVPISFINKLNYNQFKIVDCVKPKIGDKVLFQRLIIKRK